MRFVEEKKLVTTFFEAISMDTGMIVFGVNDTMKALEMSALEKILLYDEIEVNRYEVKTVKGETTVLYLNAKQEEDPKSLKDANGDDYEIVEKEPLGDWLCVNYQHFGCKIELITDKTQEGF